jgi:hypothetical protein
MRVEDKLDYRQYYELIDRLHVVMSHINDNIIQHPVCKIENQITTDIEKAMELLISASIIAQERLAEK